MRKVKRGNGLAAHPERNRGNERQQNGSAGIGKKRMKGGAFRRVGEMGQYAEAGYGFEEPAGRNGGKVLHAALRRRKINACREYAGHRV